MSQEMEGHSACSGKKNETRMMRRFVFEETKDEQGAGGR